MAARPRGGWVRCNSRGLRSCKRLAIPAVAAALFAAAIAAMLTARTRAIARHGALPLPLTVG